MHGPYRGLCLTFNRRVSVVVARGGFRFSSRSNGGKGWRFSIRTAVGKGGGGGGGRGSLWSTARPFAHTHIARQSLSLDTPSLGHPPSDPPHIPRHLKMSPLLPLTSLHKTPVLDSKAK